MTEVNDVVRVNNSPMGEVEREMMSQFVVALRKLRYELEKNISEIDVLNTTKLKTTVSMFNGRLAIFQSEFLQYLKEYSETIPLSNFSPPLHSENEIPKLLAIVLGSALSSAILLSTLVVGTSGFWFWATTVTLGGLIGAKLGIPAGWATAGVSIAVGAFVGGMAVVVSRPMRRRVIKVAILRAFDKKTTNELKEWAMKRIREKIYG